MSKEFDDLDPRLQRDVQRNAPIDPNGAANGVGSSATPEPVLATIPAPAVAVAGQLPDSDDAIVDRPTSPDVAVWCPRCQRPVEATDKGQCRSCGRMLAGNRARTKLLPLNVARRNTLEQKYLDEYRPPSQHLRSTCAQKAAADEMLERVRLGTPEHQRLVILSQTLAAALEASRPSRPQTTANHLDLTLDQQIDRTSGILRHLMDLKVDERKTSIDVPTRFDTSPIVDAGAGPPSLQVPEPESEPEPVCPFCGHPASSCVEIRDEVRWLTEHQERPDVIAHFNAQAALRSRLGWDFNTHRDGIVPARSTGPDDPTEVVLRQIGKPWYTR